MDTYELLYNLKSARRKKRLQKKDLDKRLIKLDKQRALLYERRLDLPMVPLAQPYQKGWKRSFVLINDVKQSPQAEFYQALLDKINTVQYNHDKSFKQKKRRKRWKQWSTHKEKVQQLKEFSEYEWKHPKLNLSEKEKSFFQFKESWCAATGKMRASYPYTEPWRFVLAVKPHIIYEVKMLDEVLEQEIQRLANYIDNNHLEPKISRLIHGYYHWRNYSSHPKNYTNELKNKTRYHNKEAYLE
jgi:hypothetical protein